MHPVSLLTHITRRDTCVPCAKRFSGHGWVLRADVLHSNQAELMTFAIWALIIGALLISMALSGTALRRLPLSTAMLYLAVGYALGPAGLGLMSPDPLSNTAFLEGVAEVAVLACSRTPRARF